MRKSQHPFPVASWTAAAAADSVPRSSLPQSVSRSVGLQARAPFLLQAVPLISPRSLCLSLSSDGNADNRQRTGTRFLPTPPTALALQHLHPPPYPLSVSLPRSLAPSNDDRRRKFLKRSLTNEHTTTNVRLPLAVTPSTK